MGGNVISVNKFDIDGSFSNIRNQLDAIVHSYFGAE